MTTEELHKILDNKNKKLTRNEMFRILFELQRDCEYSSAEALTKFIETHDKEAYINTNRFYQGESNAFQIAMDLLWHLEERYDKA